MNLITVASRNLLRNKFRTTLTVVGVAVAVITFILLRTILDAWTVAADYAAKDRIATRHKVTFVTRLPLRYMEQIRNVRGLKEATYADWFGAKDPKMEQDFFSTLAVETDSFFQVYDEMVVKKDVLQAWKKDPAGAIVGDVVAKKHGWKVGDKVTLTGTIYPGDWTFTVYGEYIATRKSIDRSQFIFHWKYLNDSVPERMKDQIGWVVSRIDDPTQAGAISQRIDKVFESQDIQTLSMSEHAMNNSFLGMFSAALKAMDVVSIVILAIMMLVLGNTIAMGVRERTQEYGVLRAVGFLPKHLAVFVFSEALTVGGLGALLGVLLSYPIVEGGLGRFIEENMGAFFPYFRIAPYISITATCLALLIAALAAAIPAYQASKLNVINALRRVG